MWSNYFFTQRLFLHLQSPWHQLAPFPWGQFRQDDALWFPQLTGFLPLFFLFTFTHLLPFHHHLLRGWTNGGSMVLIFPWNQFRFHITWKYELIQLTSAAKKQEYTYFCDHCMSFWPLFALHICDFFVNVTSTCLYRPTPLLGS